MTWLIDPSERQRELVDGARAILGDRPTAWPRSVVEERVPFSGQRWRDVAGLGWIDEAASLLMDDADSALLDVAVLFEELGRSLQPEPYVESAVAAAVLGTSTTPDHRKVLSAVVAGDSLAIWCWPGGFGDSVSIPQSERLRVSTWDSGYCLSGRVRAAVDAASADYLVAPAQSGDGNWVHVLLPAATAAVRLAPLESMDLTRRYSDVYFDGVLIREDDLIGPPVPARQADREIELATVLQCAEMVGIAGRCFEATIEYTKQRVVFGRVVASYQAIKHRLANMYLHLEASRAITAAAAGGATSQPFPWMASAAKAYVADTACEIVEESMQLHGGVAFTWDSDMHLYLRRARTDRMRFGSPAAHRTRIAGEVGIDNILTSVFGA